ncbi:MAG: hypothetical protein ACE5JL_16830 [Dehalococcoidia bacterium]
MGLNTRTLAFAAAIFWGGAVFLTGLLDLIFGYGRAFLEVVASLYPGYAASGGFGDLVVGGLYAALDGLVAGAILGWLYNRLLPGAPPAEEQASA